MVFLFFVVFVQMSVSKATCVIEVIDEEGQKQVIELKGERIKFASFTPKTIKNSDKSFNF